VSSGGDRSSGASFRRSSHDGSSTARLSEHIPPPPAGFLRHAGPAINGVTAGAVPLFGGGSSGRRRSYRSILIAVDAVALAVAYGIAAAVEPAVRASVAATPLVVALGLLLWLGIATASGLYERDDARLRHSTVDDVSDVLHAVTLVSWAGVAALTLSGPAAANVLGPIVFWAVAQVGVLAGRALVRGVVAPRRARRTIIVGAGEVGRALAARITRAARGITLIGFVDPDVDDRRLVASRGPAVLEPPHERVLGRPDQLPQIINQFRVERVILAFSRERDREIVSLVRSLRRLNVEIDIVPRLFEALGPELELERLEATPLMRIPAHRASPAGLRIKRLLDLVLAVTALVVLLPLLAAIAVAIRLDSPGPAVYRSERIGRCGRRFPALKFRTMHIQHCRGGRYGGNGAEVEFERLMGDPVLRQEFDRSRKLARDPRVTRLGATLRRYSFDELPQLINVVTGDLSLVGPRPVTTDEWLTYRLTEMTDTATGGYWDVSDLRPGLTGWWQVNGRSEVDFEERTRLDFDYLTNWSLKLDSTILLKTFRALRNGSGRSGPARAPVRDD
jgi:exopolysaccharide biosynthesis polyprenyl glycosylphosphotransferase